MSTFTPFTRSTIANIMARTKAANTSVLLFFVFMVGLLTTTMFANAQSVVVNKYQNTGTSADIVELLVVQDNADLRGLWIKDFSSSNANDGGGGYQFNNITFWSKMRAGTLIIIRANSATTNDVATSCTDFVLDIGATNTTYFTAGTGSFDLSTNDMLMIKSGTQSGTANNIHTLRAGSAGTQWSNISTGTKIGTTSTASAYALVDNANAVIGDFNLGTTGVTVSATGTLGSGNNANNTNFINFLRGPVSSAATVVGPNGFTANWAALTGATAYLLDVDDNSDFSSPLGSYNGVNVGNVTSAAVIGLNPSTTYYYRVRATNATPTTSGNSCSQTVTTSAAALPPVINSVLTATGTYNSAFTYTITATNTPTSFGASGLPSGLSINTGTGAITGTPASGTAAGSPYNVGISATNGVGTDNQTLVLTINKASQTITFGSVPAKTYGDASFTLGATSSSGLPVSYAINNASVATVSGNTVTITGAGTATITASQSGDADYNAATSVNQTLTVNKANQTISFGTLVDKYDTSSPYTLTATSSSGLPVSYASGNTAVITISGNTATVAGVGSSVITASQAGDANYNAATSVNQTQNVLNTALLNQTITFGALSNATYGDGFIKLTATASSSLPVSYASSDPTTVSISNDTAYIIKNGTVTITASQAGGSGYNAAANVSQSFTVTPKNLTVTGAVAQNKTYDGTTTATLDLTGASLVGVVGTDVVTFSGNGSFADANAGTGKSVTTALSLGGADASKYSLTQPAGLTADISQASQTITFNALAAKTYGSAKFKLTATTTSNLAITYSSDNTAVISIVGDSVTIVGAGTANITASQAGDVNYAAATSVTQVQVVNQASQTITFPAIPTKLTTDAPFTLAATASSGLAVSYAINNSSVATISGNTVTIVGAGTATITASQAGDANYTAATDVTRTLTVTAPVIVAWDMSTLSGGTNNYGPSPYAATTVASNVTATGLVRGSGISTTGSAASRGWGGLNYTGTTAANGVTANQFATFTVKANTGYTLSLSQVSRFDYRRSGTGPTTGVLQYSLNGSSFTDISTLNFSSTSSSGANLAAIDLSSITALQNVPSSTTVTFRVVPFGGSTGGSWYIYDQGNSTANDFVFNGTVNVLGAPVISSSLTQTATVGTLYTYNIVASNSPSSYSSTTLPDGLTLNTSSGVITGTPTTAGTYSVDITATNAGGSDTKTLSLTVNPGSQTITFGTLPVKTYGDASFTLSATASSGLPVSYSINNSSVATISGNTVTIVGAGTATITASQGGNANWNAATSVDQTLTVNKANQTISFSALADQTYTGTPINISLTATASSGLPVAYSTNNASVVTISGSTATIVGPGDATITASQAGDANYNAASPVAQPQHVIDGSLLNQTITFNAIPNATYGDGYIKLTASASSSLPVSYVSSDPTTVSISNDTAYILKNGTVTITASQAGGSGYNPAPSVSQSFTVDKKNLTVSGAIAQNKTYDGNTTATINLSGASLVGVVGTDVVTVSGGGSFADANAGTGKTVTTTLSLGGADAGKYTLTQPSLTADILQASQTITFNALPNKTTADIPFALNGSASSGLTVSYTSSNTSVATVSGNIVTIVGAGTTSITASQAGNTNYSAATPVSQTLTVTVAPNIVTWNFGTTTGTVAPTGGVPVAHLTISNIAQGNNNGTTAILANNSVSSGYTGASGLFNANAAVFTGALNTSTSTYFDFTLTPDAGYKVNLSGISFGSRSTATGPQAYAVRTSSNSYASDIATGTMPNTSVWGLRSPSVSTVSSGYGTPITVRIYGYNGTGTAALGSSNWRLDDVSISVTLDAKPVCSGTPTAGTASAVSSSFCSGGNTTVNLTGYSDTTAASGISFQWYSSTDNSSFSPVGGANGVSLATGTLTQTTYYYCVVSCSASGLSATSNTVTVTVNNGTFNASTVAACNSYTWHGTEYTASGDYTYSYNNENGCASVDTLHLTINTGTFNASTIAACNSYTWHGTEYSASGDYTYSYNNENGCASVDTLHLTINTGTFSASTVAVCNSYTWHSTTYSASGTYVFNYNNENGCASADTLYLTINTPSSSTTNVTICSNQAPYNWNGTDYSVTGTYTFTTTNAAGCDSVATLNLTVKAASTSTTEVTVCASNLPYNWNGTDYNAAGTYTFTTTNAVGCDSVATLELTVDASFTVSAISGPASTCAYTGTLGSEAVYTVTATGANSYNWTWPALVTSVTGQGTDTLRVKYASTFVSGSITVTVSGACGAPITRTLAVSKAVPAMPGTISGPTNACPYIGTSTQVTYSIAPVANAITYRWTLPANTTLVSATPDSLSITLTFNANFATGTAAQRTLKVKAISGCGNSADKTLAIAITAPATPGPMSGPTNVCQYVGGAGGNAVYTIRKVANATSYNWTVPASATIVSYSGAGNTANDTSIVVSFNNTFVAGSVDSVKVSASSTCGTSANRSLALKPVNPAMPGPITGTTDACPYTGTGTEVVYTIRKVATATSYQWTLPSGVSFGPSDVDNTDTIAYLLYDNTFTGGFMSVRSVSGCGQSSTVRSLTISLKKPVTPGAIVGPTDACPLMGKDTTVFYSIRKVNYATYYTWAVPTGATIVSHPGGSGVNDTIIEVQWLNSFATGSITVVANNNCANSGTRSLTLMKKVPGTPAPIAGPTDACPLMGTASTATYTIGSVLNATSYNWTVPSGASIVSGQGTTSIVVSYDNSFTSGNVAVSAVNNCFASMPRTLAIARKLPAVPAAITAGVPTACPNRQVTYTAAAAANATGYFWTVPAGATIVSGQGSNVIVVEYPNGAVSDTVRVQSTNNCSISAQRKLKITLSACPPVIAKVTPVVKPEVVTVDALSVQVLPNPTETEFRLVVMSNDSKTPVQLSITDMSGRVVEVKRNLSNGQMITAGAGYKQGVYMAEFIQGNSRKLVKLIKL